MAPSSQEPMPGCFYLMVLEAVHLMELEVCKTGSLGLGWWRLSCDIIRHRLLGQAAAELKQQRMPGIQTM